MARLTSDDDEISKNMKLIGLFGSHRLHGVAQSHHRSNVNRKWLLERMKKCQKRILYSLSCVRGACVCVGTCVCVRACMSNGKKCLSFHRHLTFVIRVNAHLLRVPEDGHTDGYTYKDADSLLA